MTSQKAMSQEIKNGDKESGVIVIGSIEKARELGIFGDSHKSIYITKEEHERSVSDLSSKIEDLGRKYNQLLYNTEFFKAKTTSVIKDMSSREDDFFRRISTEISLFKSEKTKSVDRIRNSDKKYEEQAKKSISSSKRVIAVDENSSGKRQKNK